MKITAIRLDRMRLPLDPPFHAARDPVPRRHFGATLVRVETDEGIIGQVTGQPVSVLFGAAARRLPADASFGEARSPQARADAALAAKSAGFGAAKKIRISRTDPGISIESVRATRLVVGDEFVIMADLNRCPAVTCTACARCASRSGWRAARWPGPRPSCWPPWTPARWTCWPTCTRWPGWTAALRRVPLRPARLDARTPWLVSGRTRPHRPRRLPGRARRPGLGARIDQAAVARYRQP